MVAMAATLAACDRADDGASSPYADRGVSAADVPPAYSAPLGIMVSIARGGLVEQTALCEGFSYGNDTAASNWRAFRSDVNSRLGKRAGVLTDISRFDPASGMISISSRPIGGDAKGLETHWKLRTKAGGDDIHSPADVLDCIESVKIEELTS